MKSASTIGELAAKEGLPATALEQTVEHYNQMIVQGVDSDFHSFNAGSAEKPAKIAKPPYYAAQIFPLSRKSMGGIRIDHSCRVVNRDGKIIPGLYAAGEAAGFGGINGRAGLEGTFLGPGILTGRVAGKEAALQSGAKPGAVATAASTTRKTVQSKALNSECMACHDVAAQIAKHQAGFTHFDSAHQVVLEKNYQCVQCHNMPMPFDAETHQMDRIAQIESCKLCHVAR